MKLIDADKLPHYNGYSYSALEIAHEVENAPAVDAVPVVHGHWIECPLKRYPKEHIDVCSVCNGKALAKYNYCPNCGAKMDEVSE